MYGSKSGFFGCWVSVNGKDHRQTIVWVVQLFV